MAATGALEESVSPYLVSCESLDRGPTAVVQTPVARLNAFLEPLTWQGQMTEWGVPQGSVARLLPTMVAKALGQEALWISDRAQARFYPNSWAGLGFNLNSLHFLQDDKPLTSLRTLLNENHFPLLMIDCQQRLQISDLHFFAQHCRQQGTHIFLFRPFYLSNRNGNPFSKQRFNSSYCITQKIFQLYKMKGAGAQRSLRLPFSEVLCG
jgi:hypothetical protein